MVRRSSVRFANLIPNDVHLRLHEMQPCDWRNHSHPDQLEEAPSRVSQSAERRAELLGTGVA